MENTSEKNCIVCKKDENQVPLVELSYKNKKYHICPQHIPIMIHNPGQLEGLIPDAGNLTAG